LLGLAMLLFFATQPSGIGLFLGALSAGIGLGATIAIRSATLADVFDGPSLGLVTGAYQWAYALGGGAVGWAGAYVYEHFNSYAPVFGAGFVAMIIWAICLKATLNRRNDQGVAVAQALDSGAELQAKR
jgi:MFS family permease